MMERIVLENPFKTLHTACTSLSKPRESLMQANALAGEQ